MEQSKVSQNVPDSAVSLLAGKYEVIGAISHGAFGRVLKVRNPELDKIFAAKVLVPSVASLDALKRLNREALALSKFEHPNIVRVYTCALDETAGLVVVMDYLEGIPLDKLVEQGTLEPETAISLAKDICAGLQCAHEQGIFHRDLKPGNVMVVADENGRQRAVLIDFGIAKMQDANQKLTQTGAVLGTPLYMSPEQYTAKPLDSRSDIYSLGCVLYEMLVGVPPFRGENPIELAARHTAEHALLPSRARAGIAAGLDAIIMKCLEKDPANRYQTASAVAADLERVDLSQIVQHFQTSTKYSSARKVFKFSARLIFPIAAACIAGGAVYWRLNYYNEIERIPNAELEQHIQERVREAQSRLDRGTMDDLGAAKEIACRAVYEIKLQTPEYKYVPGLYRIWAKSFRLEGRYAEAQNVLSKEREADFNLDLPDRTAVEDGLNYFHREDFESAIAKFGDARKFQGSLSFDEYLEYKIGAAEAQFFGHQRKLKYGLADAHGLAAEAFQRVYDENLRKNKGPLRLELAILQAECKNGLKQYVVDRNDPNNWGSLDWLNPIALNIADMAKPNTTVLRARFFEARAEALQGIGKNKEAARNIAQLKRVLTETPDAKNEWEANENALWLDYVKKQLVKLQSM